MGTPTNMKEPGGPMTSSNLISWQGPNIPCIKLYKGDNITEVVYKLATQLCNLLTSIDVKTFDLKDLSSTAPENFHSLVQLILDKLNSTSTPSPSGSTAAAPATGEIQINEAFYYKNSKGDTLTTMTPNDYAQAIGNKVGAIVGQINTINNSLTSQGKDIAALKLAAQSPQSYTLPEVIPTHVLTKENYSLDAVVVATEKLLGEVSIALGTTTELYEAMGSQPAGLNQAKTMSPTGTVMGNIPGWKGEVKSFSDVIKNLWLSVQDLREAVIAMKNVLPSTCDAISLSFSGVVDGNNLLLSVTGNIPEEFEEKGGVTLITIKDTASGILQQSTSLKDVINGQAITILLQGTSLNKLLDFTVEAKPTFTNIEQNVECQSVVSGEIVNTIPCPTNITANPTSGSTMTVMFNHTSGSVIYTVEILTINGDLVASQSVPATVGGQAISVDFGALSASTTYKVRVSETAGTKTNVCPIILATTPGSLCAAPTAVSSSLTII